MNISATAAMGYTYTNIKTGVSQKKDVSNENTCAVSYTHLTLPTIATV